MHSIGLKTNPLSSSPLPEWYRTYFTALLEADERRAFIQLERAAKAIEDRLVQLRYGAPEGPEETQDLTNALTYLRLLLENIKPECAMPASEVTAA